MRLDVVTIFPAYLEPLRLSLPGRAIEKGLLSLGVHDLRDWTHDRHRTVDDTPYGGGAGMVMRPEPWGEALDALLTDDAVLVVPTPSGQPFTQEIAVELATRQHLIFACGRYEGIDQRVIDHFSERRPGQVRELSIGDYVLNGGEVAALAMIEAVVRLVPGFMGNPDSLVTESHTDRLLEAPAYTKPVSWRGLDVPPVLLSGDHAAIAGWRTDEALRRTTQRRPDLAHASEAGELTITTGVPADAGEIYTLQRACWLQEAIDHDSFAIPAFGESLDDVRRWMGEWTVLVGRRGGRLVAAARGLDRDGVWDIGRLMVAPDLQGEGLGRQMLGLIEGAAPDHVREYSLFTGELSERNHRMYRKAGYRVTERHAASPGSVGVIRMAKVRKPV